VVGFHFMPKYDVTGWQFFIIFSILKAKYLNKTHNLHILFTRIMVVAMSVTAALAAPNILIPFH
jgi:hypothetical protein